MKTQAAQVHQDNSYEATTVPNFSDLNFRDGYHAKYIPAIWHIGEDFDEDLIESGDYVSYFHEFEEDYRIGVYINLWQHTHPDETSPYPCDSRVMAYIRTETGYTYADVLFIEAVS